MHQRTIYTGCFCIEEHYATATIMTVTMTQSTESTIAMVISIVMLFLTHVDNGPSLVFSFWLLIFCVIAGLRGADLQ